MKTYFFIVCFIGVITQKIFAQDNIPSNHTHKNKVKYKNAFPDYDNSLLLEDKPDTTANVSSGDLDGDGHLDILLVKGRHWPIIDRVLLGNGKGGVRNAYNLSDIADRSYAGALGDFNEDGIPDIAATCNEGTNILYFGSIRSKKTK